MDQQRLLAGVLAVVVILALAYAYRQGWVGGGGGCADCGEETFVAYNLAHSSQPAPAGGAPAGGAPAGGAPDPFDQPPEPLDPEDVVALEQLAGACGSCGSDDCVACGSGYDHQEGILLTSLGPGVKKAHADWVGEVGHTGHGRSRVQDDLDEAVAVGARRGHGIVAFRKVDHPQDQRRALFQTEADGHLFRKHFRSSGHV